MSDGYEGAIVCKALLELLPDENERRRYALLQAEATIYSYAATSDEFDTRGCVDVAEKLLAEIERRERAEAKR